MTHPLIDYVLAYGWDYDDVTALEQALEARTESNLEEALALLGEHQCSPITYCELVAALLEWYRD